MADHVRYAPGVWVACRAVRILFSTWHGYAKAEQCKYLTDTVEQLQQQVTDLQEQVEYLQDQMEPEKSIWRMKKEQLVEVAVEELELTRAQAQKQSVDVLRQRIKARRDILNAVANPLDRLPVGFSKMKKEELEQEMQKRGLPLLEGMNGRHHANTRGYMKVAIQDDVEQRALLSARPQTQESRRETPGTSSTSGTANNNDTTEWLTINTPRDEPIDAPRATSRRRSS